ncbi:MAG: sugar 3,4-ketoisomerase [Caldisphaera sp.]
MSAVDNCKILKLKKITDSRGNLTFIESGIDFNFEIKRVYYIYDVPSGAYRGAHAHKNLEQLMIALSGSFDVTVDDGKNKKTIMLNNPALGLYLPKMIWREMKNFSTGSVCLVLASDYYDEKDYIRDYSKFLKLKGV